MKDYLNLEGLSHFLNKLLAKFIKNDDVITDDEIDIICSGTVETSTNGLTSEDWVFTLEDDSTVTKKVVVVE